MTVKLKNFLDQEVYVTYRNGVTSYATVESTLHKNYPYRVGTSVYTPIGRFFKDGLVDDRDIISIALAKEEEEVPDFRAICEELVKVGTDYIFDDREVVEFDQALIKARKALQDTEQSSALVKGVGKAIAATCKPGTGHVLFWDDAAKAAILAVAQWLLTEGASNAYCGSIAAKLELEAEKTHA